MKSLYSYLCGICVGAADIVPGISGGTVAFIIGIYERLLAAIGGINRQVILDFFCCRFKRALDAIDYSFFFPFLLGIATSFILLASLIHHLLHHEVWRTFVYAGFMGLVFGSALFCAKLVDRISLQTVIGFLFGAVTAFFLSSCEPMSLVNEPCYQVPIKSWNSDFANAKNVDSTTHELLSVKQSELDAMVSKKYLAQDDVIRECKTHDLKVVKDVLVRGNLPVQTLWYIACGALAISAMLLPGISGSYILQVLGMYGLILGAIVDFIDGLQHFRFDATAFSCLASVGCGIVLGAIAFSRVVRYLLTHYRQHCIACLVGFMVGAMRAVWPFWRSAWVLAPSQLDRGLLLQPQDPIFPEIFSWQFAIAVFFFFCGIGTIFVLEHRAKKMMRQA